MKRNIEASPFGAAAQLAGESIKLTAADRSCRSTSSDFDLTAYLPRHRASNAII
jgi:hypothetical protein